MATESEHGQNTFDRIITFFDAVLAIAITLLVLEIAIPTGADFGTQQMEDLFPQFTAFVISFVALGQIWMMHNGYFSHLTCSKDWFIFANFALMAFAILFPKTTELIAIYPHSQAARIIYLVNYLVMLIGVNVIGGFVIREKIVALKREHAAEIEAEAKAEACCDEKLTPKGLAKRGLIHLAYDAYTTSPLRNMDGSTLKVIFAWTIGTSILSSLCVALAVVFLFLDPKFCYIFLAALIAIQPIDSRMTKRLWGKATGVSEEDSADE